MKGTRPLDNDEIRLVYACFDGTFAARNRGLFMLGVSTGGRISELLSLTIGDVYQNGKPVSDLLYDKSIVKGGEVSRAVPVNTDGMRAIDDLIRWHREQYRNTRSSRHPCEPSKRQKPKHTPARSSRSVDTPIDREKVIALLEGQVAGLKTQLETANTEKAQLLELADRLQKQNEVLMLPVSKRSWWQRLRGR